MTYATAHCDEAHKVRKGSRFHTRDGIVGNDLTSGLVLTSVALNFIDQ